MADFIAARASVAAVAKVSAARPIDLTSARPGLKMRSCTAGDGVPIVISESVTAAHLKLLAERGFHVERRVCSVSKQTGIAGVTVEHVKDLPR